MFGGKENFEKHLEQCETNLEKYCLLEQKEQQQYYRYCSLQAVDENFYEEWNWLIYQKDMVYNQLTEEEKEMTKDKVIAEYYGQNRFIPLVVLIRYRYIKEYLVEIWENGYYALKYKSEDLEECKKKAREIMKELD